MNQTDNQDGGDSPLADRFIFLCGRCESPLEADRSMIGQAGRCPSCGAEFGVPPPGVGLGAPVAKVDPRQVEWERAAVHAYASAGSLAPRIVTREDGPPKIECPRCGHASEIEADRCARCGRPFTMEGVAGATPRPGHTLAVLCLVLGLLAVPLTLCGGPAGLLPAGVSLGLGAWAWGRSRPGRGSPLPLIIIGVLASAAMLALAAHYLVRNLQGG